MNIYFLYENVWKRITYLGNSTQTDSAISKTFFKSLGFQKVLHLEFCCEMNYKFHMQMRGNLKATKCDALNEKNRMNCAMLYRENQLWHSSSGVK